MTVRELITQLLEYDMDLTVDVEVNTSEETLSESAFDFEEYNKYLSLVIEPRQYVLVDKSEFKALHDRIEELENE